MEAQTRKGEQLALDKEAERLLEKRLKLANELADAFARNQDPNFGAFSADESAENLIGLINNLSDLGVTLRDAQAEADKIFGQKGLLSRSNLEDNTEAAREQAEEYEEFDALLTRFEPIVKGIGRGFADAILGIKGFGQALKDSLIRALDAVITKVISLIALYAILFALSGPGGTTGSLGTFLKAGFGGGDFNAVAFDTFSFLGGGRSATGGGGGSRQGFRLQGKDLVLSTQRSGRSLTRIG